MLKVFFGNDEKRIREAAWLAADAVSESGSEVVRVVPDGYQVGELINFSQAESLFGLPPVYLVDIGEAGGELREDFFSNADALADSKVSFIVIAGTLLAADKKIITAAGGELEEFKAVAEKRFDTFALAEAVAKKDKKNLVAAVPRVGGEQHLYRRGDRNNLVAVKGNAIGSGHQVGR
jgi:hypothetical protein